MNKINQYIISCLFLIFTLTTFAQQINDKPDFAYPQKAVSQAEVNITTSLETGNGQSLIKSLVEYSIAQSLIDSGNLPHIIERIEIIANDEKDPCIKAILHVLLIDIYDGIYNSNKWKYDQRNNPLIPLPKDYKTWDGNQFKHKILTLCDLALANPNPLKVSSLKEYASIITHNNLTFQFYPSLYDFIARHIIEKIKKYSNISNIMPVNWLCEYNSFVNLRFTYTSPIVKLILTLYQNLISLNINRQAAFIDCDIDRISFLNDAVYNSDNRTIFELLQDLFSEFHNSEYSAEILIAMYEYAQNINEKKWLYNNIKTHIEKYPNYTRRNCLENLINEISRSSISIYAPKSIIPGDTLNISINNNNTFLFKLNIYYITGENNQIVDRYSFNDISTQATLLNSIEVKSDSIVPFIDQNEINITLDKPGYYFLVPVIKGDTIDEMQNYSTIRCSNLTLMESEYSNEHCITIVNSKSGVPIDNADIFDVKNNRLINKLSSTDNSGHAYISKNGSYNIVATKDDNFSNTEYLYISENKNTTSFRGKCLTDLAVYHPGDSLKLSTIVYQINNKIRKLYTDKIISIKIYNPNHQEVDTISILTDKWGRITHKYKLPTDGITGAWTISAFKGTDYIAGTQFTVSDYKLPTFFIQISDVQTNSPEKGAVTLTGKAETYSGFPLADIDINLNLSVSPRNIWWRTASSNSFYSTEAKSGPDGNFTIILPAELLESSPIPNGIFNANISATSSNGESQQTNKIFTLGKTYNILASIAENIEISKPIELDIKLSDINNNIVNDTIHYSIRKEDKIIYQGEFLSNHPTLNLNSVPSGCYSFTFAIADSTIAQPYEIDNICLYRNTDKMPPVDTPLWVPTTNYTLNDSTQKANILYGTTYPNSHIEYFVWNSSKIISKGWLTPSPGLHHFVVSLPEGSTNLIVSFRTYNKYNCTTSHVKIELKDSTPSITLQAESFRDKITPGAKESWKFRVIDNTGNGSKSALILDMYTKALDKIKNVPWNKQFNPTQILGNSLSLSKFYQGYVLYRTYDYLNKILTCPQLTIPQIDTYGYNIVNGRRHNRYGSFGSLWHETKAMAIMTDDMGINDVAESEDAMGIANEKSIGANTVQASDDFSYRAAEEPLAFFEPMLTTDDEGRLSFQFTVPNANTTWAFNAIAYNRDLLTTNLSFDVVANKPIMVQPNTPRFLRSGDNAEIQASIMNNSDSIQTINTIVEIFDCSSAQTLQRYTYNNIVKPLQSAVISTSIIAPHDSPFIGYRIKSSTNDFADGEQSLIPVLPSTSPFIETTPFYIAPDSTSFNMKIPTLHDNARVTLQFCENPVWYCITALPGLRANESRSSLSAMAAIFSAAIAEGIIRNNPEIALAFKQWQQSDRSDSTLTSMLERNQDLKTILLNSTPWVMDARSDTERMTRLMLIFDKNEIKQVYTQNIKLLEKLQHSKGGWRWIAESNEPSEWCTMNILEECGNLKRLGFLPNNKSLNNMITNAVKFLDDINARQYVKNPSGDYTHYVYIRDFYDDIKQSTAATRVTNGTLQQLISNWRDENVTGKAIAATILNNHKYYSTAKQILNSIREYSRTSASLGMWWPSLDNTYYWSMGKVGATSLILDAFNAIEPSCADIDKIRQWLILQKEASDWDTSVITSQVISSILYSGAKWHYQAQRSIIKINDNTITPSHFENVTGYFRENISDILPREATLSIIKPSKTPSWGSIYYQYTQENRTIKAISCDAASIEKNIYRQISTPEGIKWETADKLNVGDKVKIELVIKTTRDMDYVAIIDNRAACFEPIEQLPVPIFTEGIYFYRENRDATTNIFVNHLPKGTYLLTYEVYVNNSGSYSSGIASIQSQYAPELSAHSSGNTITTTIQNN